MTKFVKISICILLVLVALVGCKGSDKVQEVGNTDELRSSSNISTDNTMSENSSSAEILPNPSNAPLSTDYSANNQEIGDDSVQNVKINSVNNYLYADFIRITFELDTSEKPKVQASYSSASKQITLNIRNVTEDISGIKLETYKEVYNSVVSQIFHSVVTDSNTSRYLIGIKKDTVFFLHTMEKDSKTLILLDIKEVEGAADLQAPGANNDFVNSAQSINPNIQGNIINIDGYSYSNQGDLFRIIWNTRGNGDNNIPIVNVVENSSGGIYKIVVSIGNIQNDYIAKSNLSTNLNDRTATKLEGSVSGNISTYTITVSKLSEFKIYSSLAPSQVILDIKY